MTPADLASWLHDLASRLEAAKSLEQQLELAVEVGIQISVKEDHGPESERISTIDGIATLLGITSRNAFRAEETGWHYRATDGLGGVTLFAAGLSEDPR
jgi:hypothetical protein